MLKWGARFVAAGVVAGLGLGGVVVGAGGASAVGKYSTSDISSWGEGWKFSVWANVAGDYDETLIQLPAAIPHKPYPDYSGNYASVSVELVDSTGFSSSEWLSGSYLDGNPHGVAKTFLSDGQSYDAIVTYDWESDGVHGAFSITREFHFAWHEQNVTVSAYKYTVTKSVTVSQTASAAHTSTSKQTVKQTVTAKYKHSGHTYTAKASKTVTRSATKKASATATARATRSATATAYLKADASSKATSSAKSAATTAAKQAATAAAKKSATSKATAAAKTAAHASAKSAAHKAAETAALRAAKAKAKR